MDDIFAISQEGLVRQICLNLYQAGRLPYSEFRRTVDNLLCLDPKDLLTTFMESCMIRDGIDPKEASDGLESFGHSS